MLKKISPCCTVFCGLTALGLFIFSFFATGVVNNALFDQAAKNVVLKPETYEKWGAVPGSTGTVVYKNYSFFNFTNPEDFTYFNKTAKLIETPSFNYQEIQNLLDPNYTNNSQGVPVEVSFYHQRYNIKFNTTDDSLNRTVISPGPMGFWQTAKTLPIEVLGMSAFAVLQGGFVKNLYPNILAKGILNLNMKDQQSCNSQILNKLIPELTNDQKNAIWSDPLYGMSTSDSFALWCQATLDGVLSGSASILKDYFQLTTPQIAAILSKPLSDWITNLNNILANWYNCTTIPCDFKYIGALQWTQQGVTMNPPKTSNSSGPDPFPSIATVNRTVAGGYPELSYYMNEVLFKNNFTGNPSDYANITFSIDFGLRVLNSTITPPYSFPASDQTLLNIKNFKFVLDVGQNFENNGGNPNNLTDLQPIKDKWNLETLQHAFVFYSYMKYFAHEFALKESINGTRGYLALGKVGSQAIYDRFNQLKSFLFLDIASRDIYSGIKYDNISCPTLVNNSLGGANDQLLNKVCSIPQLSNFDVNSIKFLVSACRYDQQYSYQVLVNSTGLTRNNMLNFCQSDDFQAFGYYLNETQSMLHDHYGCSNISNSCSDFEFAAMQWGSSAITQSLPPRIRSQFPVNASDSVASLYPDMFKKPFEFYSVVSYLSPNYPDFPLQGLSKNDTLNYLSSLTLFSPSMVQKAFLLNMTQDIANFSKIFGFTNPIPLLSYIRYMVIEHAFNGISQQRSGYELLYGYKDNLLDKIATSSPLDSGNPAINSIISVGGQNSSEEEARKYFQVTLYTGGDDPEKVKVYKECQHLPYITYNHTYFDGMDVKQDWVSPWKDNIPLAGTDSSLNQPNLRTGQNFTLFVSDMYFVGANIVSPNLTERDIHGIKTKKMTIENVTLANKTNNPVNARYFSDKYNTVLNLTKARMLPAFLTKQYLLDADWSMIEAVEMYSDENMTKRIWPDREYDLAIYVEPTTGASLRADQRLQLNLLFEPDELFPNVKTSFVPMLYFYRGYEFSENTVSAVFGPLKTGFAVRNSIFFVLLGVSLLCIALTVWCACLWKKSKLSISDDYIETGDPEALLITNKRKNDDSVHAI